MDDLRARMDLNFSSLPLKRLSYLILVALAAYFLQSKLHSPQTYWLIWTAFLLSLITTGDSFKRRITTIIITGLAAAFVSFVADSLTSLFPLLAIYLFIVTVICVLVSQLYPEYLLQSFIVNVFAILSSGSISLSLNTDKFMLIIMGISLIVLLQIIFYPYFIRNELKSYILISLKNLKKLNTEIFTCFLEPEYSDNIYLYENRLHARKSQLMASLSHLRQITRLAETKWTSEEIHAYELLLTNLDLLFENMLDYSQLRRRVTDYTTFSICHQELTTISKEIGLSIDGVMAHLSHKKYYPNMKKLSQSINQLENNFHNVLQVATREPLVFLIFIDSLNAFCSKLEEIISNPVPLSSNLS